MLRRCIPIVFLVAILGAHGLLARGGTSDTPAPAAGPLSVEQVVNNLIRRNEERAQGLRSSESTRLYRLVYQGFPGDREAQMTVHAIYTSPATKTFEIISQSGSKLVLDRVFKKLLESEKEAAVPEMRDRTLLNRSNYEFEFAGYESSEPNPQYVLQVAPKFKSKYVYRGKIWVDATDFAVTRIEAEPAQNPSFWTKKSEIHHEYTRVQGFWLPLRNQSISYIRLGGRATLTIEYKDYKVNSAPEQTAAAPAIGIHK